VSSARASFWWLELPEGRKDLPGEPDDWTLVGKTGFKKRKERDPRLAPEHAPDWAQDLFRVARAAFLTDKRVLRKGAPDHWTRHLRLSVPVTHLSRWQSEEARSHLSALLQTLSGDVWEVTFRPLTQPPLQEMAPEPP
jgi:hypothetical protein